MYRRRKFYGRKKRKFNYGRFIGNVGKTVGVATAGLALASKLASVINTEWKNYGGSKLSNTEADNSGVVWRLAPTAQGDDVTDRIGNSILPKKLNIRLNAFKNAGATTTQLSIYLLKDMEYDGANPAVTDILSTAHYISLLNLDNSKRFRILKVKRWTMDAYHPTKWLQWQINFNKPNPKRKRWYHIKYKGSTANDSDAREGQLIILAISDQAANVPTIDMRYRLRYIDN